MKPVEAPLPAPVVPRPVPDWRQQPLVLVGLMGAGKSTVGRRLAAQLHRPFIDADSEIEVAAGMPITDMFARFGEAHFRDGERRVIARLMEEGTGRARPPVIATGGGAFVDPETRALILARGTAIWLDAALDTLVARVGKRSNRPLLQGRDPRIVLAELLEIRRPCYAQAPIHISSGEGPHEDAVAAVMRALEGTNAKATA